MGRILAGGRLVIASHNPGKLEEIADLLRPFDIETVAAGALNLPEPDETGSSFAENAALKAAAAAGTAGLPALSDDSGLAVAALDGRPGIHSARWAGPGKDFRQAMARVERELAGKSDRRACFVCALCLVWPDGREIVCEGRVEGDLVWPPRGERGFGYDPMFRPRGHDITFGEMDPALKHAMSHRARAFEKLLVQAFDRVDGERIRDGE
jgi:XTP/dITP diphosphohydrolase